jgi:hypothetical protein
VVVVVVVVAAAAAAAAVVLVVLVSRSLLFSLLLSRFLSTYLSLYRSVSLSICLSLSRVPAHARVFDSCLVVNTDSPAQSQRSWDGPGGAGVEGGGRRRCGLRVLIGPVGLEFALELRDEDVLMDGGMDGWMHGRMRGWMDGWRDAGRMDGRMGC